MSETKIHRKKKLKEQWSNKCNIPFFLFWTLPVLFFSHKANEISDMQPQCRSKKPHKHTHTLNQFMLFFYSSSCISFSQVNKKRWKKKNKLKMGTKNMFLISKKMVMYIMSLWCIFSVFMLPLFMLYFRFLLFLLWFVRNLRSLCKL